MNKPQKTVMTEQDISQQLNPKQPLLVFGGPYSNLHATRALQHRAQQLNIPPSHCICTGDTVAYCASPKETVTLLRDWGVTVLMGNCEESLADNADDCGCGFAGGSQCDLLSVQWYRYAKTQLTGDQRTWLKQLPRKIVFRFNGFQCQVVHGAVTSINRFVFPSDADTVFAEEFAHTKADIIFSGHSGIPFTRQIGDKENKKLWHNTGAIGLPANDGSTNTWYSLIHSVSPGKIRIEHHPLSYDFNAAKWEMITAGLNNGYAHALSSGLWPSMDILPSAERLNQGVALKARQVEWSL